MTHVGNVHLRGANVLSTVVEIAHLLGGPQVLASGATATATVAMVAMASFGGTGPPAKNARFTLLGASTRYTCRIIAQPGGFVPLFFVSNPSYDIGL
jgi:hypothetical protein